MRSDASPPAVREVASMLGMTNSEMQEDPLFMELSRSRAGGSVHSQCRLYRKVSSGGNGRYGTRSGEDEDSIQGGASGADAYDRSD